jgi:hypothetical protein
VSEEAKQGMNTIESTTETAKQLKNTIPKSIGEVSEAIKGKAKEEATKKEFDLLQYFSSNSLSNEGLILIK